MSGKQRNPKLPAYRNLGGPSPGTHPRKAIPKPCDDPPAIVPCPYCMESVVARGKRYWDAEVEHRHQPKGNPKYGVH